MATVNIDNTTPNPTKPNLLSSRVLFKDSTDFDYTVNSGVGTVTRHENSIPDPYAYSGLFSMEVTNTNYQTTDLIWSSPSGIDSFQSAYPSNHFFQFTLRNLSGAIDTRLEIEVFQDGSSVNVYSFLLDDTTIVDLTKSYTFGFYTYLDSGFEYTLKYTLKAQASGASSKTIYISGLCLNRLDMENVFGGAYQFPQTIEIFETATLDFPSIAHNYSHTLDATVTGAKVGDFVKVVPPVEVATEKLTCIGIVTAEDTVTVIMSNNAGGSVDLASAVYKFHITRN